MKQYVRVDTGDNNNFGNSNILTGVIKINRTRNFGVSISNINLQIINASTNFTNTKPGKQIRVYHSDSSLPAPTQSNTFFKGFITKQSISDGIINLECADYLVRTQDKLGEENYEDSAGISIKTIIQDLCVESGLTYDMSGIAITPSTVKKFDTTNQTCFGRITYLLGLINWFWYFDPILDDAVLRPREALTLQEFRFGDSGTNITSLPEWSDDSGEVVNKVISVGGASETRIYDEEITGTHWGGNLWQFILSEPYEDMVVTKVIHEGIELTVDQYKVMNHQTLQRTIVFIDWSFLSSTDIEVDYFFNKKSRTNTQTNITSQTDYGLKEKSVNDRKIVELDDLIDMGTNLVSNDFFGDSIEEVRFSVNEKLITPILGSRANVYDGVRNRNLLYNPSKCIVLSISSSWPGGLGGDTITVSTKSIKDPYSASHIEDRYNGLAREVSQINPIELFKLNGENALTGAINFNYKKAINFRLNTHDNITPTDNDVAGQLKYDTVTGHAFCYNAVTSIWDDISTGGSSWNGNATSNLDMNDYDITECDTISATPNQDLTFKITSGRAIIWTTL